MSTTSTSAPSSGSWIGLAACTQADADRLFGRAVAGRAVRAMCAGCPVHVECLASALATREDSGVWGGLTANDRRIIHQAFPEETDWPGRLGREGPHTLAEQLRAVTSIPAAQRVARRLDELP